MINGELRPTVVQTPRTPRAGPRLLRRHPGVNCVIAPTRSTSSPRTHPCTSATGCGPTPPDSARPPSPRRHRRDRRGLEMTEQPTDERTRIREAMDCFLAGKAPLGSAAGLSPAKTAAISLRGQRTLMEPEPLRERMP